MSLHVSEHDAVCGQAPETTDSYSYLACNSVCAAKWQPACNLDTECASTQPFTFVANQQPYKKVWEVKQLSKITGMLIQF